MSWNVFGKKTRRKFKALEKLDAGIDLETFEIAVDPSLNPEQRLQAELHELGHAILSRLGVVMDSNEVEEIIVDGYATWIVENKKQLLRKLRALEKKPAVKRTTAKSARKATGD